ncbi:MAG: hypothetical protein CSA65_09130 [Proteobacteria bacterium]|nr:MAG: hypothetical protein CSA65_09130 [Pseudomonadota bacterium]
MRRYWTTPSPLASALALLAAAVLLTSGCTKANPSYIGDEAGVGGDLGLQPDYWSQPDGPAPEGGWPDAFRPDGPRPDRWVGDGSPLDLTPRDGTPQLDRAPREDAAPTPDLPAPDLPAPDLLAPDLLAPDLLAPDGSPTQCTHSWECEDGLSCTQDTCVGGVCVHSLQPGSCLINGVCRAEGWSPFGDDCNECVTALSTNQLSFVSGKVCVLGVLPQGTCVQNACKRWETQTDVEPSLGGSVKPSKTVLTSVDAIGGMKQIWVVGRYTANNATKGGLLRRVDPSTSTLPREVLSKHALADVSYRLAVGAKGTAYYYTNGTWKIHSGVQGGIGSQDRAGVWGAANGSSQVFYISGTHAPKTLWGVVRCAITGNQTSCTNNTGFQKKAKLGPIFAAINGPGSRLWVLRQGSKYDDIYSKSGAAPIWSDHPPAGCRDSASGSGNQPCSNSNGDYRGLYAASTDEGWIVGDNGQVLRYSGGAWAKKTLPGLGASSYQLTSVYADGKEGLVTIVGHIDIPGAVRQVVVFNYNTQLNRWFGPIPVETLPIAGIGNNDPGQVRHIGGSGYNNLWMVGDRWSSLVNGRRVGWVLRLK